MKQGFRGWKVVKVPSKSWLIWISLQIWLFFLSSLRGEAQSNIEGGDSVPPKNIPTFMPLQHTTYLSMYMLYAGLLHHLYNRDNIVNQTNRHFNIVFLFCWPCRHFVSDGDPAREWWRQKWRSAAKKTARETLRLWPGFRRGFHSGNEIIQFKMMRTTGMHYLCAYRLHMLYERRKRGLRHIIISSDQVQITKCFRVIHDVHEIIHTLQRASYIFRSTATLILVLPRLTQLFRCKC